MMNLQGPILAFASSPVQVLRPQPQTLVKGMPQSSPPLAITIRANVQPLGAKELLLLPEGERTKDWILVHACDASTPPLRAENTQAQTPPDVVVWQGRSYVCKSVSDWAQQGSYWSARCSRVGQ